MDVLCVRTANSCRSPIREVLLGSALRARAVDAHVPVLTLARGHSGEIAPPAAAAGAAAVGDDAPRFSLSPLQET